MGSELRTECTNLATRTLSRPARTAATNKRMGPTQDGSELVALVGHRDELFHWASPFYHTAHMMMAKATDGSLTPTPLLASPAPGRRRSPPPLLNHQSQQVSELPR
jgi:hypothetical protein